MGNSESKRIIQYPQKKLKSVEIFSSSRKGDGSISIKEISSIAYYLFDSCHFIAIYDGYGHYGGAAAFDARDALLAYFEEKRHLINQVTSSKDIKLFIAEGIAYVHQKLSKEKLYAQSGTCCIGALILQSKMYIFNVGNSRAALCTKVIMSGFKTIELSRDHNLNSLEERTRVLNKGLKVHRIMENGKEEGPERVWIDETGPGITTTRGLGSWQVSKGIIPEPEIEEYDLNSEDVFLVLGSDGLWDVLGTEEVTGMLFEKKREKDTVESLVKEAQRRWRTVAQKEKYCVGDDPSDGPRTDDISAVVCYFNFPTAEDMEKLNRFDFLFENKQARLQSLKEKMEK